MRNHAGIKTDHNPAFVRFPRIGQQSSTVIRPLQPGGTQDAFLLANLPVKDPVLWHPELTTRLNVAQPAHCPHAFADTVTFIQNVCGIEDIIGQYATGSFGSACRSSSTRCKCQEKLP